MTAVSISVLTGPYTELLQAHSVKGMFLGARQTESRCSTLAKDCNSHRTRPIAPMLKLVNDSPPLLKGVL